MLKGIDVSHHQGAVNWSALQAAYGISWGACKATEGKTFQDASFADNWRGMKSAGLVRMAYHFAHPDNDASVSAKAFLSYVDAQGIESTDIMVMDMEGNSNNLPMLAVRDWLAKWADIVTAETGRKPFIYVGGGYITNDATKGLWPHYAAWWYPRYPAAYAGNSVWPTAITGYPMPNNWQNLPPDIWQFTQSLHNQFDGNIANMTLQDLRTRGTIQLELPMTFDQGDKDYLEGRLKAYFLWQDMRNRRMDLLLAQSNGSSADVVALCQKEYDTAFASWSALTKTA